MPDSDFLSVPAAIVLTQFRQAGKFPLGAVVATPNALRCLTAAEVATAMFRHQQGDWGELDAEDKAENDRALAEGSRLLSAYNSSTGGRFWIITEVDRSVTTILLPEDY